jgi:hypothetical protein
MTSSRTTRGDHATNRKYIERTTTTGNTEQNEDLKLFIPFLSYSFSKTVQVWLADAVFYFRFNGSLEPDIVWPSADRVTTWPKLYTGNETAKNIFFFGELCAHLYLQTFASWFDTKFVAHQKVDKNKTLYYRSVDCDDPSKTNDDARTFDNNIVLLQRRVRALVICLLCRPFVHIHVWVRLEDLWEIDCYADIVVKRLITLLSRSIIDQVFIGRYRRSSNPLLPVPTAPYNLGLPLFPFCFPFPPSQCMRDRYYWKCVFEFGCSV